MSTLQVKAPSESGMQFVSSSTKASKTNTKQPKTQKKSKKTKLKTWIEKEVEFKRPKRDGDGDDYGSSLC